MSNKNHIKLEQSEKVWAFINQTNNIANMTFDNAIEIYAAYLALLLNFQKSVLQVTKKELGLEKAYSIYGRQKIEMSMAQIALIELIFDENAED